MTRIIKLSFALLWFCSFAYSQITFQKGLGRVDVPPCSYDRANSFVKSPDNGYVLAGVRLEANTNFFSWTKADSIGNFLWDNAGGSSSYYGANSISFSSDSGFILCGQCYNGIARYPMIIKINSGGNILWHKTLQGYWEPNAFSILECFDKGLIFTGETPGGIYGHDILLAKLNSNGTLVWSKYFTGFYSDEGAYSVIQDLDSGYVICGFFTDGFIQNSALLMKVDSMGNFLWSKIYSGTNMMCATRLYKTLDGGFIFSGYDRVTYPYDRSFIIKTNSLGDTLWTRQFVTSDPMVVNFIEQTPDKGYILTGSLGPQYATKPILLKLDSIGNMQWSTAYNSSIGATAGIGTYETSDRGYIIGCDRLFYLIKTDSIGQSCGSYNPIIQILPGNQIIISSIVLSDSLNVLSDVLNFFSSPSCDTFSIDDCVALPIQTYEFEELNVSLFPNISNGFINIECEIPILSAEIFNSMGQKLFSKNINSEKSRLDIAHMQSGVYFIRCLTISGYSTRLLIKQ